MPTATDHRDSPARTRPKSLAQVFALIVGVVFLAIGVAGFVPGLTTNVRDIPWAGHDSPTMLFGAIQVSILHNLVHVLFGALGVATAASFRTARLYLFAGGAVYLVLWLFGLVVEKDAPANFIPVNTAADWLHFGLGLGMIALGAIAGTKSLSGPSPAAPLDPTRARRR
jgi:hypothetical protein